MSSLSSYVQVSPDPEETPDFQVVQHRVMMEPEGRMVFQGALEPRVSPERYWEPHLEHQEGTVYREPLETRASLGHREHLDYLVGPRTKRLTFTVFPSAVDGTSFDAHVFFLCQALMDASVFLGGRASVESTEFPVRPALSDLQARHLAASPANPDFLAIEDRADHQVRRRIQQTAFPTRLLFNLVEF